MITDFIATVAQRGFNPGNRYSINVARQLSGGVPANVLSQYCENVSLPGRSFATSDVKFGTGFTQKMPYNTIYDDVSMTFRIDEAMGIKSYFDAWQNIIHNKNTGYMSYYDSYKSDIDIVVYNRQDAEVHRCKLMDAYPISVASTDLSHATQNEILKLTVTFAYKLWR